MTDRSERAVITGEKIYLVTDGDYSDYHVCGVFSTRENAELFIGSFRGEIEEYNLDPCMPELREGFGPFFVRMALDGTVIEVKIDSTSYGFSEPTWFRRDVQGNLIEHVMAKDKQHAVKIVNERRVRFLLESV